MKNNGKPEAEGPDIAEANMEKMQDSVWKAFGKWSA